MDALKVAFLEIRKVRDCESVHALLLDCWQVAQERGEAEGLKHAAMLLRSVREYVAAQNAGAAWGRYTNNDGERR